MIIEYAFALVPTDIATTIGKQITHDVTTVLTASTLRCLRFVFGGGYQLVDAPWLRQMLCCMECTTVGTHHLRHRTAGDRLSRQSLQSAYHRVVAHRAALHYDLVAQFVDAL